MTRPLPPLLRALNSLFERSRYQVARRADLVDFHLHEYESYEAYKKVQVSHNIRKLENVWADAATLDQVARIVRAAKPDGPIKGICHGARNGFEQDYLSSHHAGFDVIGTDISDTATQFPRSVVWDFHDDNPAWHGAFDFVYSNSLDQGWQPKQALSTWLGQVAPAGTVIIEHTDLHGPDGASEMDPFGVRPHVFPYVIAEWFGHQVSVTFWKGQKSHEDGREMDVWLFQLRRLVDQLQPTASDL